MATSLSTRLVAGAALALLIAAGASAQDQQPAAQPEAQDQQQPATQPEATDAEAPSPDAVVATVDGKSITEGELALAESDLDPQFARLPAEQRRAAALSAIIEIRLLANEAEEAGLADDKEFKTRMTFLRDRALHSAFIEKNIAGSVSDDDVKARYDKEIAALPASGEVRARHILVKTEEEAMAIIAELDGGGDFEAIAKEKSSDPGSGAQGGDLGYFGQGQMVPEFEQAAFALEVGAHTKEPVKSQFGFHVIRLEDKRDRPAPELAQVADTIRSMVLRDRYFDTVKGLRGDATVDIPDAGLKTAVEAIEAQK
jgi:peptidyl-prolyl cis-trans isomerase C